MEYIVKVECPECGYMNRLARYEEEECYKCGSDLHEAIQENKRGVSK